MLTLCNQNSNSIMVHKSHIIYTTLFVTLLVGIFVLTNNVIAQTNFTKYDNNPVLDIGLAGDWDDLQVKGPSVIYDGDIYHMWYDGESTGSQHIGYATSSDGVTWVKYSENPVILPGDSGEWDVVYAISPSVVYNDGTFYMYYTGYDGNNTRIGCATSIDGITWIKCNNNPILDIGTSGSWDYPFIYSPSVLFDGDSTYHMWYVGWNQNVHQIGYATSSDGVNWNKYENNPVLSPTDTGSVWDNVSVEYPSVIFDGETFQMWYSGYDGYFRIGYANSPNGIDWNKYEGNPVLDIGASGSWESENVYNPSVLFVGNVYHIWYSGHDGSNVRIGYGTDSSSVGIENQISKIPLSFVLNQNFPNPFNPITTISYNLPQSALVNISIYNITGQLVETLVSEDKNAGYHSVIWNANGVGSGLYFYRMKAGEYTETKKCLILK